MSIKTAVRCDTCGADLSSTEEPAAYRLTLVADSIPSTFDPHQSVGEVVENPVPTSLHFCGLECLAVWAIKDEGT